jgi:hypothetical protein
VDRHLLPDVALLRQVLAVNVCKALPDDQPQPAEEGLVRLLEVVVDALDCVDVGLLQHV